MLGTLHRAGQALTLRAPAGSGGLARNLASGWVEHGTALLTLSAEAGVLAADDPSPAASASDAPPGTTVVRADTDGLFYARPEPGAAPYAAEGTPVAASATLGLVEVMKTFTPLRSPVAGTVLKVLANDGASVEAGQPLFWIGPAATASAGTEGT